MNGVKMKKTKTATNVHNAIQPAFIVAGLLPVNVVQPYIATALQMNVMAVALYTMDLVKCLHRPHNGTTMIDMVALDLKIMTMNFNY
jgi:hypothetical protein